MYIGKFRVFKTTKNLSVFPTKVSKGKVKYIHFLKRIQNTLHQGIRSSAAKHVHMYIFETSYPFNNLFNNWTSFISNLFRFIFIRIPFRGLTIKLSKDKKRKYFNFAIQNYNSMYWGVCFSSEKHALFNDISKDNNNIGIEINSFMTETVII